MTIEWRITLSAPQFDEREEDAVRDVIRSRWLTLGPRTAEFEESFAEFIGVRRAVAVANCTGALHLALRAVGIGEGDRVVVPSMSFVATANSVIYAGGVPVFADIVSRERPMIDPDDVDRLLSEGARAVIGMHYGGFGFGAPAVREIADRHGVPLIEDAAHAPGATDGGLPAGTIGVAGCFSFFSNKNLATGEGGMIVTDSDEIAESARRTRSHGMTSLTWDRHLGAANSYEIVELGFNERIDEVRSALGIVQLEKLPAANARRRELTAAYREALADLDGVTPVMPDEDLAASACHLAAVLMPDRESRDAAAGHLRSRGIQTSMHYQAIHTCSYYQKLGQVSLPRTEEFADRELTLPLHPGLTEEEVTEVVAALAESLGA